MLLFVLAALTIFHFALPRGSSHEAALGLLWTALVFTALLGLTRAFVPEREQGMFDALVLAPCDRSAIWLGKALAVLAFLVAAEVVALPAFAAFFSGLGGRTVAAVALADVGICAVGTLLGAMAVAGRARELLLPLLFLPLAIPIVVGGVGRASARGSTSGSSLLYDAVFALLCWAAFEYVVVGDLRASDYDADAVTDASRTARARRSCCTRACSRLAIALIFFYAPTDADQGLSQRIFYFHVPIALTAYACFGWGAWKALRHLLEARRAAPTSRATSRSTRA